MDANMETGHFYRFPLPISRKEKAQERYTRTIRGASGDIYEFEFDFFPSRTTEDLCNSVPHNCDNCEWNGFHGTHFCQHDVTTTNGGCDRWEISSEAFRRAEIRYLEALHEEHYGKSGVPV